MSHTRLALLCFASLAMSAVAVTWAAVMSTRVSGLTAREAEAQWRADNNLRPWVLRDSSGTERIRLGMRADGTAELILRSREDKSCVRLEVDVRGEPSINLIDAWGATRCGLGLGPTGAPCIAMHNQDGKPGFFAGLDLGGMLTSYVVGKDGEVRWEYR